MTMNYKEIINHLNDPDFKESKIFFHANNMPLEESFCWILAQRLNKAKKLFCHWMKMSLRLLPGGKL